MTLSLTTIVLGYAAAINFFGFILMGIDKYKAVQQHWRIPESNLFLTAIIGGSIGSIAGMYVFRHKTQHLTFVIGMPLILIIQLAAIIWLKFYSPFTILMM